jgi:hypothetical protein
VQSLTYHWCLGLRLAARSPPLRQFRVRAFANVPKSMERKLRSRHLMSKRCRKVSSVSAASTLDVNCGRFRHDSPNHTEQNQRRQNSISRSEHQRARWYWHRVYPPTVQSECPPGNRRHSAQLGVNEDLITQTTALLRQVGPKDLIKVENLDVHDDVLYENGFVV